MIYGYARVSTKTQLKGNSLEEQRDILSSNGCQEIIAEQYTGTTTDRPKFHDLIAKLSPGDTLMVTKLDCFARNVTEGIALVRQLFTKQVKVHVLNVGLLEDTAMGNFFITTLLAVAELERNMIVERTQSGKAIAKTKAGFTEGRPRLDAARVQHALELLRAGHSYKEVSKDTGISVATLVRAKRRTTCI